MKYGIFNKKLENLTKIDTNLNINGDCFIFFVEYKLKICNWNFGFGRINI